MNTNTQQILSTPDFSSLQVDAAHFAVSTPNFDLKDAGSVQGLTLDTTSSTQSARSMQTPPPTTTSASKRQAQQTQIARLVQQSPTGGGRRMSAPSQAHPDQGQLGNAQVDESPLNFSTLDFSPDMFGYNFAAPATAPAYPQHKLFWETTQGDGAHSSFVHDIPNPFDSPRPSDLDIFGPSSTQLPASQSVVSSSIFDLADTTPTASFAQPNFIPASSQVGEKKNPPRQLHNGVDPSLLFSSPGKFTEPQDGSMASARVLDEESLQPYAYQVQEAKRERAYGGIAKSKKKRKPSVDSPAVRAALETLREDGDRRPQVRRSMTDSVVTQKAKEPAESKPGPLHGRSSPLKRMIESRSGHVKAKSRTSIALTIDENGRARAETRLVNEDQSMKDDKMNIDSESEDTQSDSFSDDSEGVIATSFAQQGLHPKNGRFNSSAPHSQKSSYTSFYSSSSQQEQPSLPELKPRHKGTRTGGQNRPFGKPPLRSLKEASAMEEDQASEAETIVDSEEDNAQNELRKLVQDRRNAKNPQPTHHVYSPRKPHKPVFGRPNDQNFFNASPTTLTDPDLTSPSSQSSDVRCVCNGSRDDAHMIQCESCKSWLHISCTGLNPSRLPLVYLCKFCTGTPDVRGGRVRDPLRKGYPVSPLAKKGQKFR